MLVIYFYPIIINNYREKYMTEKFIFKYKLLSLQRYNKGLSI